MIIENPILNEIIKIIETGVNWKQEKEENKTLKNIKKVITVENKANFVLMPVEENALIIFTHGFLAPLECRLL